MSEPPLIEIDLLKAYAAAVYESWDGRGWRPVEAVSGPGTWAVVSACNPYSKLLTPALNHLRHAQLAAIALAAGCTCIPARGRAADHAWTEESWLVRATVQQIDAWARAFEQHAVYLPAQHGYPAGLRIYSAPADGNHLPAMGNLRLEWVGCDPPSAT